jgi:aminoglycoside 3-N-acetyltransferase
MEKISVTEKDIAAGLRDLGLRRGDAVEVHSSLSSFGWVKGSATTVIEALMQVVSEEGALVMSAYPVSPPIPLTEEEEARGITWKVRILDPHSDERTGLGSWRIRSASGLMSSAALNSTGAVPGDTCASALP